MSPIPRPVVLCSVVGCGRERHAHGWCHTHYCGARLASQLPPRPTRTDRFWAKVDKNGPVPLHALDLGPCWIWIASTDPKVCHHCDTPPCVNPVHLFLGAAVDNAADMAAKERGTIKLPAEEVRNIRAAYAAGEGSITALARAYGISVGCASMLIHRTRRRLTAALSARTAPPASRRRG